MSMSETPASAAALHFELSQFLYREAALLDAQEWDAWGALFTSDGVYWVPAARDQVDAVHHVSLIHENALLREIRLNRLKKQEASSLASLSSSHLVSNVIVATADHATGRYTVHSRFVVAQHASWGTSAFHGGYTHELARDASGELKIRLKRVDLVNVAAPLGDVLTLL